MMTLLIVTVATGISFGLFAVLPQFIINSTVGTEKVREALMGTCWGTAVVGLILVGMLTQRAAWVAGLVIGFFLTVGIGFYLAWLMGGGFKEENDR